MSRSAPVYQLCPASTEVGQLSLIRGNQHHFLIEIRLPVEHLGAVVPETEEKTMELAVDQPDRTEHEKMPLRDEIINEIRDRRDRADSLCEAAEWSVAYEEAIGGRPPTRGEDMP